MFIKSLRRSDMCKITIEDIFEFAFRFKTDLEMIDNLPKSPMFIKKENDYGITIYKIIKPNSVMDYIYWHEESNLGAVFGSYNHTANMQAIYKTGVNYFKKISDRYKVQLVCEYPREPYFHTTVETNSLMIDYDSECIEVHKLEPETMYTNAVVPAKSDKYAYFDMRKVSKKHKLIAIDMVFGYFDLKRNFIVNDEIPLEKTLRNFAAWVNRVPKEEVECIASIGLGPIGYTKHVFMIVNPSTLNDFIGESISDENNKFKRDVLRLVNKTNPDKFRYDLRNKKYKIWSGRHHVNSKGNSVFRLLHHKFKEIRDDEQIMILENDGHIIEPHETLYLFNKHTGELKVLLTK